MKMARVYTQTHKKKLEKFKRLLSHMRMCSYINGNKFLIEGTRHKKMSFHFVINFKQNLFFNNKIWKSLNPNAN